MIFQILKNLIVVKYLYYASSDAFADVVQELIHNGVDINSKCGCEWMALHWACQNGNDNGARLNEQDLGSNSVLHYATSNGRLNVIKLLGPCCDWTIKNERGQTAFNRAKTDEIKEVLKSFEFLHISLCVSKELGE